MKALLDRLPIRHKLIALIMLTTTAVLVVAGVIFVVSDYLRARRDVLNDLVAREVPIPTATDLVLQLTRAGVKDGDLTLFQRNVRADIDRGADPTVAAQTRARGLVRSAGGRWRMFSPSTMKTTSSAMFVAESAMRSRCRDTESTCTARSTVDGSRCISEVSCSNIKRCSASTSSSWAHTRRARCGS